VLEISLRETTFKNSFSGIGYPCVKNHEGEVDPKKKLFDPDLYRESFSFSDFTGMV